MKKNKQLESLKNDLYTLKKSSSIQIVAGEGGLGPEFCLKGFCLTPHGIGIGRDYILDKTISS